MWPEPTDLDKTGYLSSWTAEDCERSLPLLRRLLGNSTRFDRIDEPDII